MKKQAIETGKLIAFRTSPQVQKELLALQKKWGENATQAIKRAISEAYQVHVTRA